MTKTYIAAIRKRILSSIATKSSPIEEFPIEEFKIRKTSLMMMLERAFNSDIVYIVASGSLSEVANRTGLDKSTISKWRKRISADIVKSAGGEVK